MYVNARYIECYNKTHITPQFSDVIALAGNSGLPSAFRTLPPHKTGGKKPGQTGAR
jgi:hypothetical protein